MWLTRCLAISSKNKKTLEKTAHLKYNVKQLVFAMIAGGKRL